MSSSINVRRWIALAGLGLLISLPAIGYQDQKKPLPLGTPLLWQEPVDIASRNLYLGPGGEALKPDLSKVTLTEEKESSSAAKYRVRDGANREWVVKVGGEAQSEVTASRLVWAAGYFTDITYLVPSVEIEGVGVCQNVKFEARPKGVKRLDEWLWDDNPFIGKTEFQGLKLLLVLLDNWNLKNENNKILYLRNAEAGNELRYIISDFDTTYDRSGAAPSFWHKGSKGAEGAKDRFIAQVKDGNLLFDYAGRHKERLSTITLAQAKWLSERLSRLSEQQIKDACRAGNYSAEDTQIITRVIRARIIELANLK
jgi:hypothetical protein